MPSTLTVGTNSYITVVDAATYFGDRIPAATAWAGATDDQKTAALISATKRIDRLRIRGRKYLSTQALAFPRTYNHPTVEDMLEDGSPLYSVTSVPQYVKDACCEEALALLDYGDSKRLKLQAQGVAGFTVGSLSERFKPLGRGLLSEEAFALLRDEIAGAVPIR